MDSDVPVENLSAEIKEKLDAIAEMAEKSRPVSDDD